MGVFSPGASRGENILPLHGEVQPGMKVCLAPKADRSACVINFSARAEKIFAITWARVKYNNGDLHTN